jgi:hypothetical protein
MANHNQTPGNALELVTMQGVYDSLDPEQRAKIETEFENIGHSRSMCESIGVKDYNHLPGEDQIRIYKHAMETLGYLPSE